MDVTKSQSTVTYQPTTADFDRFSYDTRNSATVIKPAVTANYLSFLNDCSLTFLENKENIHSKTISITGGEAKVETKSSELSSIPINERLDEGSCSFVYKGTISSEMSRQEVAIKKLKLEQNGDIKQEFQEMQKKFQKEIKALLSLQEHQESIVQFICAIEVVSSYDCYLVMELGDMPLGAYLSLIKAIPEAHIDLENLMFIVVHLFKALEACIQKNVFHIDLHAENYLIFFAQQKIKMIDFGILAEEQADNSSIIATMIRQTTGCLIECAVKYSGNRFGEDKVGDKLKTIAIEYGCHYDSSATAEKKSYFQKTITSYFHDHPLLLEIANGIFNTDGNICNIRENVKAIENKDKIKPLTDIRGMI